MVSTRKIAAFYDSGAVALAEVEDVLDLSSLKKEGQLNYACINNAALSMVKNAHEIFVREFPHNFEEAIKDKNFDIVAFYQLIEKYPEILEQCENEFFGFVQQHVENTVRGCSQSVMFSWSWSCIYGILSSSYVKGFVKDWKPAAFEKMVLAVARHVDLVQESNQQRALLFFESAAEIGYPDFRKMIVANLRQNKSFEPWINKAIEKLKGEV